MYLNNFWMLHFGEQTQQWKMQHLKMYLLLKVRDSIALVHPSNPLGFPVNLILLWQ